MMRIAAILAIAVGCGGSAPPPKPPVVQPTTKTTAPPPPDAKPPTTANKEVTAEAVCTRLLALKKAKCGDFEAASVTADTCVAEYTKLVAANGRYMRAAGRCLVEHDSCEEVQGCLKTQSTYDTAQTDLRACTDPSDGRAVGISRSEYDHRNGSGTHRYSEARSTKERPIEMCGIHAANEWLVALTCDDGSHPLRDIPAAERVRVGNVGAGGRCGSIIDHYRVDCPEGRFDIFTDGYVCPLEQ
jgi:hypothetical protein